MTTRYVVSRRSAGLGDLLICLGAAWRFARDTGRTLVADWRLSAYAPDPRANLFPLCFEPALDLAGVPLVADDRVGRTPWPRPRHPSLWNDDTRWSRPVRRREQDVVADRDAAVALIGAGRDVEAPTVVFDGCVNKGLVSFDDARTFLGALRPLAPVREAVARFRAERFGTRPLIALHVRHGNGGDILGHARHWDSYTAAIERCLRGLEQARRRLGQHPAVLLCTDSPEVESSLRARLPDLVCRPKTSRPPGQGELHLGRDAHLGLHDALGEMLLLAEGDVLLRYPPKSFFSFYAAVMRRWHEPPPPTVPDLRSPWDPADPLAPALLH